MLILFCNVHFFFKPYRLSRSSFLFFRDECEEKMITNGIKKFSITLENDLDSKKKLKLRIEKKLVELTRITAIASMYFD